MACKGKTFFLLWSLKDLKSLIQSVLFSFLFYQTTTSPKLLLLSPSPPPSTFPSYQNKLLDFETCFRFMQMQFTVACLYGSTCMLFYVYLVFTCTTIRLQEAYFALSLFFLIFIIDCGCQLQQSGKASADSTAVYQKLKGDLQAVFHVLPKDVQQLLLLNPEKAALLQGSKENTKLPGRPLIQVGVVSSISPR